MTDLDPTYAARVERLRAFAQILAQRGDRDRYDIHVQIPPSYKTPSTTKFASITADDLTAAVEALAGNGYNGWQRPLHVILTATSNPYLADRLPLQGRIQVLESTTTDYAQPRAMIFSEDRPDGKPSAFVAVDDAQFIYAGRGGGKTSTADMIIGLGLTEKAAARIRELTDDTEHEEGRREP